MPLEKSFDEAALLVHIVVQNILKINPITHVPDSTITIFIYYCSDGLDVSFSTISARMAWENAFDNAYIKPTVEVSLLNFWGNFKLLYLTEFRSNVQKAQQIIVNDSGHSSVWNYILSVFLLFSLDHGKLFQVVYVNREEK